MGIDLSPITSVVGMIMADYRAACAWSKSDLDLIHQSPAHYLTPREKDSPALAFGSALHSAVLEPEKFSLNVAVAPKCDRRTKDGKAEYAAFELAAAGRTVISADDREKILGMQESIYNHPVAKNIFCDGVAEMSFFWTDAATGLNCKCRPDYYRRDGILVDLKSTASCDPHDFQRAIATYRYHVQSAFYTDGIVNVVNFSEFAAPYDFLFVVVEKDPPYGLRVFRIGDDAIDAGRKAYRKDLYSVVAWKKDPDFFKTVIYPDSAEIIPISLPPWFEQ